MENRANLIAYWVLPIYFTISFVEFYTGVFQLSIIAKILALASSFIITIKNPKNAISDLIWLLIISNIISFPLTMLDGRPFNCYANEVMNYVPAMLFFFVGSSPKIDTNKFYKYLLISASISFAIGLFLYFSAQDWYVSRLVEWANRSALKDVDQSESSILEQTRFTSYLMSEYAISHFSMFGLAIAGFYFFRIDKKRSWWIYISLFVFLISAIISQMRVAMFCSVATIVAYIIYDLFMSRRGVSLRLLIISVTSLTAAIMYFIKTNLAQVELVSNLMLTRIEEFSIGKALQGREYQVDILMREWSSPIIGHGLGAGGAIARLSGYPGVTDQNYIKIIYENGLIGISLFLIIMIMTIFRAVKSYKYYTIELVIIAFVLVAMLGSNTLCFSYLYILPFWFAVGRVWNINYLNYAINNKIKI